MTIRKKLKVKLLSDWIDYSIFNKRKLPTFIKSSCKTINPLQIEYAIYNNGKIPNPSVNDLLKMCKNYGIKNEYIDCLGTYSGECIFGIYATAIYKTNKIPWIQVWHMSNDKDFIFASYICNSEPINNEVEEAYEIVMNLDLELVEK